LCFEKSFCKQNSVIRLKSSILHPPKFLEWLRWSLVLHGSCQLLEMRWQLYRKYAFFCRVLHSAYRYFKTNVKRQVSGSASSRQKLKPICATRWVERHDSVIIFVTLLPAVVSTLEELQQENKQVEVATKAVTLLNSVQKCTFLIGALVICNIFLV